MGVHIDRIQRLAGGYEQTVSLHPAEAEVGAGFGQVDLADGVAGGGENIHAVEAFPGPAVGAPQVAIGVATHAVATAGFEVVELLWAFDFFSVDYVVGKDCLLYTSPSPRD